MRKTTFASRGLTWAFAALLAVAATPTIHAASESTVARSRLSAELPAGVTLGRASIDQTAAAIRAAVAKDPSAGIAILTTAILVKTPKQGHGELSCEEVAKMTRAAVASDVQQSSQLVERAASLHPECSDILNNLVTNNPSPDTTGLFGVEDSYSFAIGFGPGFPGSPGFVGSPPSGSVALPVVTPALPSPSPTPVTNVLVD